MLFLHWLCRPGHADREDTPLCPFRDESISTLRPCSTFETSNPSFSYISSGTLLDIDIQKVRRNVGRSLRTNAQRLNIELGVRGNSTYKGFAPAVLSVQHAAAYSSADVPHYRHTVHKRKARLHPSGYVHHGT